MRDAWKINKKDTNQKDRIYVNSDLTPKQQEADRKLRTELKARREEDPNLIIRNGKIVQRRSNVNVAEGGVKSN